MKKITAKTAIEITQLYKPVNPPANEHLTAEHNPEYHLKYLIDKKYFEDAIIFLAHCLPKREAVWWGCLCVRAVTKDNTSPDDIAALQCAEKWIQQPEEKIHRLCGSLAEKGRYRTAYHWVAAAAFWSGNNISREGDPAIAPGPYLYAHAIAGAMLTAVGMGDVDDRPKLFEKFLHQGINIAQGGTGT